MDAISDLPMLHDIDADYSPQYVKLARIIRSKIESGEYRYGNPLPAACLAAEYSVSLQVARAALAMLAVNRYLARPKAFQPYRVTWDAKARQPSPSKATRTSYGSLEEPDA